jgi:hypothetical protein
MLRHGIGTLASMTVAGNRSLPSRTSRLVDPPRVASALADASNQKDGVGRAASITGVPSMPTLHDIQVVIVSNVGDRAGLMPAISSVRLRIR